MSRGVIERGSTAQGDYVRFADGTQICTLTRTVDMTTQASGALHVDAASFGGWSFPQAFAAAPAVQANAHGADQWAQAGAVTATALAGISLYATAALSAVTCQITVTAIGRWA